MMPTVYATKAIGPVSTLALTQPRLMECDDGCQYVVKPKNNVRGSRVLGYEVLVAGILDHLGIATMPWRYVMVPAELIAKSHDLRVWRKPAPRETPLSLAEFRRIRIEDIYTPWEPGVCFGSQYHRGEEIDFARLQNKDDFIGALAVDAWVRNTDWRQAIINTHDGGLLARMVDHTETFSRYEEMLTVIDQGRRLPGVYPHAAVYGRITGIGSFKSWFARIDAISRDDLRSIAAQVHEEWCAGAERDALNARLDELCRTKDQIPLRLEHLRKHQLRVFPNRIFPNWA